MSVEVVSHFCQTGSSHRFPHAWWWARFAARTETADRLAQLPSFPRIVLISVTKLRAQRIDAAMLVKGPGARWQINIGHTWINVCFGMPNARQRFQRDVGADKSAGEIRLALALSYAEAPDMNTITVA